MWCPKCGVEYREGFDTCTDCRIQLIESNPRQNDEFRPGKRVMEMEPSLLVSIKDEFDANRVKVYLEKEAIQVTIEASDSGSNLYVMTDQLILAQEFMDNYYLVDEEALTFDTSNQHQEQNKKDRIRRIAVFLVFIVPMILAVGATILVSII